MLERDRKRQGSAAGHCGAGDRLLYLPRPHLAAVWCIDARNRCLVRVIPVGDGPRSLAVAASGRRIYVACRRGLWAADPADGRVVGTAPLWGQAAPALHVAADGRTVWVPLDGGEGVAVFDAATLAPLGTVRTGRGPAAVADLGLGSLIAVANAGEDTLSLIDGRTRRLVRPVAVGRGPLGILVLPDYRRLCVPCADDGLVCLIDGLAWAVAGAVPVGGRPAGAALSPCGRYVYVADAGSGELVVVDLAGERVCARLPVGAGACTVAVSPDGRRVAVGSEAGTVTFAPAGALAAGQAGVVTTAGGWAPAPGGGGSGPVQVLFAGPAAWVHGDARAGVRAVDPDDGRVMAEVGVPALV